MRVRHASPLNAVSWLGPWLRQLLSRLVPAWHRKRRSSGRRLRRSQEASKRRALDAAENPLDVDRSGHSGLPNGQESGCG